MPDEPFDEPHPVNKPTIKAMAPAAAPSFRAFILCWPSVHFCAKNSSARPEGFPDALKKDVLLYADDYNPFPSHDLRTVSFFFISRFLCFPFHNVPFRKIPYEDVADAAYTWCGGIAKNVAAFMQGRRLRYDVLRNEKVGKGRHMGSFNRRQDADDLIDYVNNGWLSSAEFDGPTFLWNHLIRDASQEDALQRNDVPVANLSDADVVINMPMQWYFDALASMVPTAERTNTGVEIPRIDMPTFSIDSQALSGVDAVVGNAVISTRWLDAVGNLAKAVEMTARFVGNVADRDNEGFDYLKDLIQTVRVYMDAVACNADPMTGEQALRMITQVACNEDFRLNAMQMVELLSCGLSFAQWDDTRMFAYDALNKGIAAMRDFAAKSGNGDASSTTGDTMNSVGSIDSDVTGDTGARDATATQSHDLRDTSSDADSAHSTNSTDAADGADTANSITHSTGAAGDSTTGGSPTLSPEELNDLAMLDPSFLSKQQLAQTAQNQFDHAVQFLRHDLMRISGDAEEADRFLRDNHTSEPLADAYAARLIAAERWQDLLNFVDLVERDAPNQCTVMFPEEVVPYEWESIREAALEALGRGGELVAMYQERLDDTYDPNTELNRMKLQAWTQAKE